MINKRIERNVGDPQATAHQQFSSFIRNQAKLMSVPELVPKNLARCSSRDLRAEELTVAVVRYHATLGAPMELQHERAKLRLCERPVNETHRDSALANGGRNTLHTARTDIANSENSGNAAF